MCTTCFKLKEKNWHFLKIFKSPFCFIGTGGSKAIKINWPVVVGGHAGGHEEQYF